MSHNDNTATQMLKFPVQQATGEELDDCTDTHILYHQARLAVTRLINTCLLLGEEPTEDDKRIVNEFNALAEEVGYPPLETSF